MAKKRKHVAQTRPADHPRASRRRVAIVIPSATGHGQQSDIEVLNISSTGMLFRVAGGMAAAGPVEIVLPNDKRVSGRVAWTDGDLRGFKFDCAISPADLAAVVLKADPVERLRLQDTAAPVQQRNDEQFLADLSDLRTAAGLTLEDVANELDVSRQAVWYWETGRSSPRPTTLAALRELFLSDSVPGVRPARDRAGAKSSPILEMKQELAEKLGIEVASIRVIIEQ